MNIRPFKVVLFGVLLVMLLSVAITGYADEEDPPNPKPTVTRSLESLLGDGESSWDGGTLIPNIVGGTEVSPENSYPWLVSLQYYGTHYCGGTLIDQEWILTAAHCWVDEITGLEYSITLNDSVVLGEHNLKINSGREQAIGISELHVHPGYDKDTFEYDLALLKLSHPATINDYVKTIKLVEPRPGNLAGVTAYVAGWGKTDFGATVISDVALVADVGILSDAACSNYQGFMPSSMLCAGWSDGRKDSCSGDSGGALAYNDAGIWKVAGIVSWGEECGLAGYPGIYSKVSSVYAWVHDQIGLLKDTSVEIFVPNRWSGNGLDILDGPECDPGGAYDGKCSYRLVATGAKKEISIRQKISGNAGDLINFSIFRKASSFSSQGRVIIKIVVINKDGSTDRKVVAISSGVASSWQKFTAQINATANYKAVSLSVVDDMTSGTVWIDKPSLKIVTTQERLADPSFETFIPSDWDAGENFDPVEGIDCGQGNANSGSCSHFLVGDGSKKVLSLRYKYRGNAGDNLDFSVFRKATSLSTSGRVILKVVVIHLDGSTEREVVTISNGNLSVWQEYIAQITATSDYKAISVSVVDDLATGTIWLDDFFLDVLN